MIKDGTRARLPDTAGLLCVQREIGGSPNRSDHDVRDLRDRRDHRGRRPLIGSKTLGQSAGMLRLAQNNKRPSGTDDLLDQIQLVAGARFGSLIPTRHHPSHYRLSADCQPKGLRIGTSRTVSRLTERPFSVPGQPLPASTVCKIESWASCWSIPPTTRVLRTSSMDSPDQSRL